MRYTKSAFFCAAMIFLVPAWAQQTISDSSVTIYGILDTAVDQVHGASSSGHSGNVTTEGIGWFPSRMGFRGREDLGDGLKAVFTLESGISLDTGAQGQGRLFGRQAWVGISGDFGTISLGRQYAMRYYALFDADIYGGGAQGLGTLDTGIPNARADNAIAYRGEWGNFSGGVNYSLGRDTVSGNNPTATNCPGESTDSQQCREWSAMAKYEIHYNGAKLGIVGAYERMYGGTSATYAGLTSPSKTDSRTTINAYYEKDRTRAGIGWLGRNNEGDAVTPKSNIFWLSGQVPVSTSIDVQAMLAGIKFDNSQNQAKLYTVRGIYTFSKRTQLYLGIAHINNSGTLALTATANASSTPPLAGSTQTSVQLGVIHRF